VQSKSHPLQIAIDGPVAAGKSTVAKKLAEKLNLTYIDTGAMYRCLALAAKEKHLDWQDESAISDLVQKITIILKSPHGAKKDGRPVTVYLGNKDVSWKIRTTDIGEGASIVSQYRKVRQILVKRQQELAHKNRVVMEKPCRHGRPRHWYPGTSESRFKNIFGCQAFRTDQAQTSAIKDHRRTPLVSPG